MTTQAEVDFYLKQMVDRLVVSSDAGAESLGLLRLAELALIEASAWPVYTDNSSQGWGCLALTHIAQALSLMQASVASHAEADIVVYEAKAAEAAAALIKATQLLQVPEVNSMSPRTVRAKSTLNPNRSTASLAKSVSSVSPIRQRGQEQPSS